MDTRSLENKNELEWRVNVKKTKALISREYGRNVTKK